MENIRENIFRSRTERAIYMGEDHKLYARLRQRFKYGGACGRRAENGVEWNVFNVRYTTSCVWYFPIFFLCAFSTMITSMEFGPNEQRQCTLKGQTFARCSARAISLNFTRIVLLDLPRPKIRSFVFSYFSYDRADLQYALHNVTIHT